MADRPVNNGASRRLLLLRRVLAGGPSPAFDQLCRVTAEVTGTTGASIVLLERGVVTGLLASSDAVASQLEALEHLLGEGPSVDAHEQGAVVQAELGSDEPRYNAYEHQAVSLGVATVAAFPMRVGLVRPGVVCTYRDTPGALEPDQVSDGAIMAELAAQSVLLAQTEASPGQLAHELEIGADLHAIVHQAAGMVAVQLEIPLTLALVRLRAHAFGSDQPLRNVAEAVVDRRLRFDDDADEV